MEPNGWDVQALLQLCYVCTESVFEWDPRKAEANAAKHGVSFDEALTVFLDPNALDGPDVEHSSAEPWFRRLGNSASGREHGELLNSRAICGIVRSC